MTLIQKYREKIKSWTEAGATVHHGVEDEGCRGTVRRADLIVSRAGMTVFMSWTLNDGPNGVALNKFNKYTSPKMVTMRFFGKINGKRRNEWDCAHAAKTLLQDQARIALASLPQ